MPWIADKSLARQRAWSAAVLFVVTMPSGCATTGIMMGVKVVGQVVYEADADARSKKLLGQPPHAADAMFEKRTDTFEDIRTGREMIVYPVKSDVLSRYRWVVEAENNRIVALAKMQYDGDGGKDIILTTALGEKAIGKTPHEVQSDRHFKELTVTLRNRSTAQACTMTSSARATRQRESATERLCGSAPRSERRREAAAWLEEADYGPHRGEVRLHGIA